MHVNLPKVPKELPTMEIEFKPPTARIPGYTPMVIPPSDLEAPEGVEKETTEETPAAPSVQLPVLDIQLSLIHI